MSGPVISNLRPIRNPNRLTIGQCQNLAKKILGKGKGCTFMLVGAKGGRSCKWLDPDLGYFVVDGSSKKYVSVQQVQAKGNSVWCEDVQAVEE